jgi:hypothetical protein
MEQADLERAASLDRAYRALALHHALIQNAEAAVRLTDSHYLVQWQPEASLWCVIDMAALDQHGEICSAFRCMQRCEHLDLICQLCSHEQNRC